MLYAQRYIGTVTLSRQRYIGTISLSRQTSTQSQHYQLAYRGSPGAPYIAGRILPLRLIINYIYTHYIRIASIKLVVTAFCNIILTCYARFIIQSQSHQLIITNTNLFTKEFRTGDSPYQQTIDHLLQYGLYTLIDRLLSRVRLNIIPNIHNTYIIEYRYRYYYTYILDQRSAPSQSGGSCVCDFYFA